MANTPAVHSPVIVRSRKCCTSLRHGLRQLQDVVRAAVELALGGRSVLLVVFELRAVDLHEQEARGWRAARRVGLGMQAGTRPFVDLGLAEEAVGRQLRAAGGGRLRE